jgi:hypothetical protein
MRPPNATWAIGTDRRGVALALAALLVSVLSVLALSGVSFFLSSLQRDRDLQKRARAFYVGEAGRADAFAHVAAHPGETSYTSGLITLRDDLGLAVGDYTYTVADITLPEQNQRRRVRVHAYWPTQAEASTEYQMTFYMELDDTWAVVSCMRDD